MATMMPHRLALAARLLDYPGEDFLHFLPAWKTEAGSLGWEPEDDGLRDFLHRLAQSEPIRLQERYTEAFDMSPATCLDLTYHRFGDSEKRSAALTALLDAYREAGWEPGAGQLPDHLPVLLEFLSVCPECGPRFREDLSAVGDIARRLRKGDHPYAPLLEFIDAILRRLYPPAEAGEPDGGAPTNGGRP